MKARRKTRKGRVQPAVATKNARELGELRTQLAEAEATLRAIRTGEADAVVTAGRNGIQVFTLEGAGHAYRILIESMNEGALTLTTDKMILYANRSFARLVKCPLGQVMGSSFRRFLSPSDQAILRPLMIRPGRTGAKLQVDLVAGDGRSIPVQLSLRPTPRTGFRDATISMVVTDLTAARQTEERLRALAHRVVQVQEEERGHVALELHDHITQLLCGVLFRSQALADSLAAQGGPARREAVKLRRVLGETAAEVERIARDLRPSVLEQLGLQAVLRSTGSEFAARTGVAVGLAGVQFAGRLPAELELNLFRIMQEALRNVQRHARARHVTVALQSRPGAVVELVIHDDGVGFAPPRPPAVGQAVKGLGLLGMRERATYIGGTLKIESSRGRGTRVAVRVPVPEAVAQPVRRRGRG